MESADDNEVYRNTTDLAKDTSEDLLEKMIGDYVFHL